MTLDLSALFFNVLSVSLGLDPDSEEAAGMIFPAWQDPENAPRSPRDRDLVFYALMENPASDSLWQTVRVAEDGPVVEAFPGYRLLITCYGPHCEENAHTIRFFFFLDGSGQPRSLLRKAGVYPVPSPPLPTILHEEAASLARKRADLTLELHIRVACPTFSPYSPLTSPPEIIFEPANTPEPTSSFDGADDSAGGPEVSAE